MPQLHISCKEDPVMRRRLFCGSLVLVMAMLAALATAALRSKER